MIKYILAFLLISTPCSAELIYNPITKQPVYDYIGDWKEFKSSDFECPETDDIYFVCYPLNLRQAYDLRNNVPLDGFDFWAWERGRKLPQRPYTIYTFLIKDAGGNFVWKPYLLEEINNLMGE